MRSSGDAWKARKLSEQLCRNADEACGYERRHSALMSFLVDDLQLRRFNYGHPARLAPGTCSSMHDVTVLDMTIPALSEFEVLASRYASSHHFPLW